MSPNFLIFRLTQEQETMVDWLSLRNSKNGPQSCPVPHPQWHQLLKKKDEVVNKYNHTCKAAAETTCIATNTTLYHTDTSVSETKQKQKQVMKMWNKKHSMWKGTVQGAWRALFFAVSELEECHNFTVFQICRLAVFLRLFFFFLKRRHVLPFPAILCVIVSTCKRFVEI